MSEDRHAEHRRVDPERYGPIGRPPLSARGRALVLLAAAAVVLALVVVGVLLLGR